MGDIIGQYVGNRAVFLDEPAECPFCTRHTYILALDVTLRDQQLGEGIQGGEHETACGGCWSGAMGVVYPRGGPTDTNPIARA
ncbi:hypothetical protein DLJ59_06895 [Micromonospora inaquosa]|uniref:Uncharacterized protein n=1 Tax=Micromonospora inaquosa TaxID=2203716 RepID=A0A3N9WY07_9ACTN|nr:hypothetical protein DLJ59_06895 [Micromonospora inaquosa]